MKTDKLTKAELRTKRIGSVQLDQASAWTLLDLFVEAISVTAATTITRDNVTDLTFDQAIERVADLRRRVDQLREENNALADNQPPKALGADPNHVKGWFQLRTAVPGMQGGGGPRIWLARIPSQVIVEAWRLQRTKHPHQPTLILNDSGFVMWDRAITGKTLTSVAKDYGIVSEYATEDQACKVLDQLAHLPTGAVDALGKSCEPPIAFERLINLAGAASKLQDSLANFQHEVDMLGDHVKAGADGQRK